MDLGIRRKNWTPSFEALDDLSEVFPHSHGGKGEETRGNNGNAGILSV